MAAMYGKNKLAESEIKGGFSLSNGMYCVYGKSDEGLCADVYEDKNKNKLVSMQHGIVGNIDDDDDGMEEMLKLLMESMINEF